METLLISFVTAIVGGLIVAFANHQLTSRRERGRRLSDVRIEMLLSAWKKIEAASNIEDWAGRDRNSLYVGLEDAYASIMLLGSSEQIRVSKSFAVDASKGANASSLELLESLRKSLRAELKLDDTSERYMFLRMKLSR